MHNIVQISM